MIEIPDDTSIAKLYAVVKKVPKEPVTLRPPPRKKRPIVYRRSVVQPVVADDSEPDDYLEPEAPSRPPPVPPSQTGRIPPLQSKDKSKGRRRTPPPNPSTPEYYEDPDEGKIKVSKPPQAPASVPKRPGKSKQPPPTQQDDQEVYEEPDVPALPVNKSRDKKGKKPSPPPEPDQEVYEDPDVDQPESGLAPPVPRNVPKRPFSKQPAQQEPEDYEEPDVPPLPPSRPGPPSNVPRRPAGGKPAPTPQPDDQVVYEDPDVPAQASSIPQPPGNIPKRPPGKKPPASEPFKQDEYEVPDVETPPSQKRKNENVGRVQPMKQTPKPQLKEEKTYEEPDAPPPRPAVTKVKDPPKKFPPAPIRGKDSYTQVEIKEDKGSTKPVPTVPPTATGNEVLDQQKWFYGDTNREVIRKRLEQQHVNGMYVIRNSTKSPTEPYTLQIFYDGKVYNLSIRRRPDNKYAIGAAKSDEKGFSTLLDLINFFKQNFLVLQGGSQTKLLRSLPKE